MATTAPGMRDTLRDRYQVAEGYYDGCAAMAHIEKWLNQQHDLYPQHDHYESALLKMVASRLPTAVAESVAAAADSGGKNRDNNIISQSQSLDCVTVASPHWRGSPAVRCTAHATPRRTPSWRPTAPRTPGSTAL